MSCRDEEWGQVLTLQIEKFAQHIVSTPTLHPLFSGAELAHAHKYAQLVEQHYAHSVLDSLPEWLRRTDETYGDGVSMGTSAGAERATPADVAVPTPNANTPVLVLCRKDCGEVTLEQ